MTDKCYNKQDFINSTDARAIRILCEYEEPKTRFEKENVKDTIIVFGSARPKSMEDLNSEIANLEKEITRENITDDERAELSKKLVKANSMKGMSEYYEQTRELSRRLTEWDMNRKSGKRYFITTGGGPGIMEAANRGASEVPGGKSIGLGISLPFEASLNEYITPGLDFEFHYFFTRKYWFLYFAKAIICCPGGYGTLDEMFEVLTLRQTQKITKSMPTVLFGKSFWDEILNLEAMAKWGTICPEDLDMFLATDSIDEAFEFITSSLIEQEG